MDTTLRDALRHLEEERAPAPAERDPGVMAMVRKQLEREPPPSLPALYGRAVRINPAIRRLTVRQFNARYPLQVRRRLKAERSTSPRSSVNGRNRARDDRMDPDELRARVRPVLLRYARAVAAAESTADLIDVLEDLDSYVDAVLDTVGDRAVGVSRGGRLVTRLLRDRPATRSEAIASIRPRPSVATALQAAALLVAGTLLLVRSPLSAQAPPDTDVFLASLHRDGEAWSLEGIENLTARPSYDNQPAFTPDGRFLLYTAVDEDGRADTWRYDLERRRAAPVTRTPESEYSPTPIPASDRFSSVRVEADSTQRLWSFAPDGSDPRLVLPDLRPVGYHAWPDAETVVVYVLGEPPTLRVATPGGGHRIVARDVGRSLQRIPGGGRISFVDLAGVDGAWITALDPQTGATERLAPALGESVDHAWTPDGVLLMGEGSTLYRWEADAGGAWRPIADLAQRGLQSLTRLAVAPDGERIALVAETGASGGP